MALRFLEFAAITADDSYPVFLVKRRLCDSRGRAESFLVEHGTRRILISSMSADWRLAISFAVDCARRTYPQPQPSKARP